MATASSECSRWICVYPVYVDKRKTVQEGRRIGREHCVEQPLLTEIAEVCTYFKLPVRIEPNKCYSRDYFERGRVRVCLKTPSGEFVNGDVKKRRDLFMHLGAKIPLLKSRVERVKETDDQAVPKSKRGKKKKGRR